MKTKVALSIRLKGMSRAVSFSSIIRFHLAISALNLVGLEKKLFLSKCHPSLKRPKYDIIAGSVLQMNKV